MSGLPNGWLEINLAETGSWCSGGTPSRRQSDYFGKGIPWVKSGDLPDGLIEKSEEEITEIGLNNSSAKLLPAGTISMALYGATIGKLGIMAFPAATNQACANVVPNKYLIEPYYLFFYLLSQRQTFIELGQGGAQPNISQEIVRKHPFPLPPLNEQRSIVAKLELLLSRVDACQQRLARIPVILKRFRQAVLAAACSGRLTADWREKQGIGEGDELPEGWKFCSIADVGKVCNGSTPSRRCPEYWAGDIPWVSSGEVRNCIIKETRESITQAGYDNSSVRLLPVGTILLAMIGEGKTRGQTAILNIEATINQNVAAVIISKELISSKYLWHWFQFQYEITRQSGSGSGPQALNCQRVRELPLNLPPLPEQEEIVRRVEGLFTLADQLEARYTTAQAQVDKLTQSILAKAFRGELVAQDPSDEPAEKLLERIREQQEATISSQPRLKRGGKK